MSPKPRGDSSAYELTRNAGALTRGRHSHSPAPVRSCRPSESWIAGRQSVSTRRSFGPHKNMLVPGAIPSRSMLLRGYSAASISITSVSSTSITKRYAPVRLGEPAGFPGGAFQIIGDEVRKLLGSRQTAIDREATLRHAVLQLAIDGAEIRGTLEGRNIALPVAMKQQPEAGKAEIGGERASVHTAPAVVKQGGIEAQLLRLRILDAVDPHRLLDREAQVKQLYPKAQPLTEPQRVIIAKADRL